MKTWIAVWLALAPISACAGVSVEQVNNLLIDAEVPLRTVDKVLGHRADGRLVEIAGALAFRLAEVTLLPAAPLQLEIRRGDSTLAAQLSFGVAEIQLRVDGELSPVARLEHAWVDAIIADDWPLARRLRDQALEDWRGICLSRLSLVVSAPVARPCRHHGR